MSARDSGRTVELADGDDRHGELSRELLHAARDVADLLLAVVRAAVAGHELEVVDDEEAERRLGLQAARLGAELEHVEAGGVVDEDVGLLEHAGRLDELGVVVRREAAGADLVRADARRGAHEAFAQLLGAHLEAEDGDRVLAAPGLVALRGDVLGHVERQARLADAGARGQHDEVGLLEPAGEPVDAFEPGGDAGDAAVAVERGQVLEVAHQHLLDVLELADAALLLDGEHLLLAAVEQVHGVAGVLVAELGDLVADADERAQHALLAHDAGVVRGVRRRGDELGQRVHELPAAGALEHALAVELGAQGDDVDLLAALEQREHPAVDEAVSVAVEIVRGEQFRDRGDGVGVDQHGAQHRLLRLEVVRRQMRTRWRFQTLDGHGSPGGRWSGGTSSLLAGADGYHGAAGAGGGRPVS